MRLYSDLARWWPLMSPPSHYVEEAADLLPLLAPTEENSPCSSSAPAAAAWRFISRIASILRSDRSEQMLDVSRQVNPECEHLPGDMTTLNLRRQFDRVLIHDSICYLLTPGEVQAALRTAAFHRTRYVLWRRRRPRRPRPALSRADPGS